MAVMREAWTDERLDDLTDQIDIRMDKQLHQFNMRMDKQLDQINTRMDRESHLVHTRFDTLQQGLIVVGGGLIGTLILAMAGFLATQL
jgi:hypothetical protein